MVSETKSVKGHCACKRIQYELSFPTDEFPLRAEFCHCHSCRHMTGTLANTLANLPPSYQPDPDLLAQLTAFQFSRRLTQYFCPVCGTQVLAFAWKDADDHSQGAGWDVMTGSLERADGVFAVDEHGFVGDTLDGGLADFLPSVDGRDLPRYVGRFGSSDTLPLYWTAPERPQTRPSPADRLRGHCMCGGVQFWLARPSARSAQVHDRSAWWLRDGGKKFFATMCSCNSCRLDTGMEWITWAFVPAIDISLDEAGAEPFRLPFGSLKEYQSSFDVHRYFCGTCGASCFYTTDDRPDLVDVSVGTLDAPEGARAETWLEFRTEPHHFREDGLQRAESLTLALEKGLEQFGDAQSK